MASQTGKLLGNGPLWRFNACVGSNGGPYGYAEYAAGYFAATLELISSLAQSTRRVDLLIYPIAFNFRHGIELSLKHLSQTLPGLWGEQPPTKWTHKLSDNWSLVRGYLVREPDFDPDGDLLAGFDAILKEFLEVDPSGEVFRYPKTKSGQQTLTNRGVINLALLEEGLEQVQKMFEWWNITASRMWDYYAERHADVYC